MLELPEDCRSNIDNVARRVIREVWDEGSEPHSICRTAAERLSEVTGLAFRCSVREVFGGTELVFIHEGQLYHYVTAVYLWERYDRNAPE